jgi:hypothetical protein
MINLEIPARFMKSANSTSASSSVTASNAIKDAIISAQQNSEYAGIVIGQLVSIVKDKYKGLPNRNIFLVSGTYMKTPASEDEESRVTLQPCFSANATVFELKGGCGFKLVEDVVLIDKAVKGCIKDALVEQHSLLAKEASLGNKSFNVCISKRVLCL